MIADFGYGALLVALLISVYGIAAAIYGVRKNRADWVESARLAMLLTFPLITLSVLSLVYLLVTGDYQLEYVSSVTSNSMPVYLRITALWGGQAGSLVFWSWLLAAFTTAVTLRKWERDKEFLPWVIAVALVTLMFFLIMIVFYENPFARIWRLPGGDFTVAMLRPAGGSAGSHARRPWSQPVVAASRDGNPPSDVVSGLCLVRDPVRFRHRSA